jgi:hypothetical protein
MNTDDRGGSDNSNGCGEEGGATGRFVSWLWAKIQPSKERVWRIVMVERWRQKK